MAEIKTGIFAKNVQKRFTRAQEKVLQKLGKADETKDEQFEQCVQNFKQQESEGARLQREMKAYIAAVKGMQQASMNLTESLHEVYEPDWHGKDDVMSIGKNCDELWEDFHQKLVDSTVIALDTYLAQFPDIKVRVAKRSRKLIDYDSARHHFETLQTSTVRNEKKIAKAEEDLKKAQKVFDDLNVDLQDELPTLWDSRVGFYVNTFKSVSSLEAKFHREISFLCHKLYEVMNKLAEQHSDKMFTIQGAPSDSGPLRLARTPTPPEDESPEGSPAVSPNHTLRPTSPGPPRPKSPSQLKMGPPKPPPPKVTPTKELAQEQIIDLFDGGFPEISVTSPQPNEKPGESLLDLDFDPFKPDSNTPIGQTQSPASQALSWDLWAANTEAQPAPDAGFTANWTADFGSAGDSAEDSGAVQPAADGQGWPPADGWPTEVAPQGEATTDEVRSWDMEHNPETTPDSDPCTVGVGVAKQQLGQKVTEAGCTTDQCQWAGGQERWGKGEPTAVLEERRQSMPGIIFTNEFGQEVPEAIEDSGQELYTAQDGGDSSKWYLSGQTDVDGSGSDYETAEEWGDAPGQNGGWISADDELDSAENEGPNTITQEGFADWGTASTVSPLQEQSTPAGVDFSGSTFTVNWDQPSMTEPVKPNEVTGFVQQSSISSTTDPTEQKESVGSSLLNISESTLSSDPFSISESDPFGNDPFATSGGDPFGTGNDPFANSEKYLFGQSEADASELPMKDASAPEGDLFAPQCSSTQDQTTCFASDPFASQAGDAGEWAGDPIADEITPDHFDSVSTQEPFASESNQDLFASNSNQDPFANETNKDHFPNEATQDPFETESTQDHFASETTQDHFANETNQDPFPSEVAKDLFASETTQDPFANETIQDPFACEATQDPFECETAEDPFASETTQDLFASETNPDPFSSVVTQDLFAGEPNQEPFASEAGQYPFASDTNQDPFFRETTQDPFASESTQDPFASENNQGWPGGWESASIGQTGGEGTICSGQSNGFAQWAAFSPPDIDIERSSKGSWQEVSGSSGFFSSDGQGDFIAGWPGESGQTQDQFASFPGQNNIPGPKTTAAEIPAGLKEPENSDLSEDEVANRRYGKLYQEIDTEKDEVTNKAFNGFAQTDASASTFVADFDKMPEVEAPEGPEAGTEPPPEDEGVLAPEGEGAPAPVAEAGEGGAVTTPPADTTTEPAESTAASSPPAETAPSTVESPTAAETEAAEQIETTPPEDTEKEQVSQEALESAPAAEAGQEPPAEALASAEDKESPIEETPTIETKPEDEAGTVETKPEDEVGTVETKPEDVAGTVETKPEDESGTVETKPEDDAGTVETKPEDEAGTLETKPKDEAGTVETKQEDEADTVVFKPADETSKEGAEKEEKMPIPSVVIEPASSNEGDDDRDGDIISPTATSGNDVTPDSQIAKDISSSGMPPGFMFKVETMHDFEAANPDELELKRGDIVLVVPTELLEDQDAGWLTGMKESDWLQHGTSAQKGLFPENFTQRVG
uniref:Amphiphysin n=1 Tax=Pygocentrus nattereri TaxID=42514 RepID=A0A3B4EHU6_PYGNA